MPRKVFVFSDMHHGASYANAESLQEKLLAKGMASADIIVCAGDIFEFTQPRECSYQERLDRAIAMVDSWHKANAHAEFHFVVGNHEAPRNYAPGQPEVEEIRKLWPKLRAHMQSLGIQTHEEYCQLGDTAVVHGHIDTCKKNERKPKRWEVDSYHDWGNTGFAGNVVAKTLFPLRKVIPAVHAQLRTNTSRDGMPITEDVDAHKHIAPELEKYRDAQTDYDAAPSPAKPHHTINKVIFGHVHYNFFDDGLQHFDVKLPELDSATLGDDVRYFNTGCSIKGRSELFQPILFELEGSLETGHTKNFVLAKDALFPDGEYKKSDSRSFWQEMADTNAEKRRTQTASSIT